MQEVLGIFLVISWLDWISPLSLLSNLMPNVSILCQPSSNAVWNHFLRHLSSSAYSVVVYLGFGSFNLPKRICSSDWSKTGLQNWGQKEKTEDI